MSVLTRAEARKIIDKIRENNGGITEEDRLRTPPSVLRAPENVQRKLGAAVRTLALNLYSTNTRFVFELIQNAEDNSYNKILEHKETPFFTFTLLPDRIIVDSNEDGFTEDNVRTICSTGESTKTKAGGYIGEKDIGFKLGESGLGIVTPTKESHEEIPSNIGTRMTVFLAQTEDFDTYAREFSQIPDTLILFLSKLRKITVMIRPQCLPLLRF